MLGWEDRECMQSFDGEMKIPAWKIEKKVGL
jgi:hypothetical protein